LHAEAERAAHDFGRYRVLDVGCGRKSYYPFFEPYAAQYIGVDIGNPIADVQGTVEDLKVDDASYDVVLCTQLLEHTPDPPRAVRELARVTAPGGRVLASTHGVQVYHPDPDDFWRWTHTGLDRLFRENADWTSLSVTAGSGSASCIAMLLGTYVSYFSRSIRLPFLGRGFCFVANSAAAALDRSSTRLSAPGPSAIFANYHVTAER
jgi:SAM-dependent methyltransferase